MLDELKKVRFPLETGLLIAFCLFLPLVEFWKNLALLAYFIVWTVNRARTRDFGGPWRVSDTLAALWLAGAFLSAYFAGLQGNAWSKTGDVAVSTLLFWLVMRAGYRQRELRWTSGALVVSMLAGTMLGFFRMWSGIGKTGMMQLYSVGHVNHTAIYLAIMLGLCASWTFARWRAWRLERRWFALAAIVLTFAALTATWSRAALAMGAIAVFVLAIAWWPRWRAPLITSALAIVIAIAGLVGFGAGVVRKQIEYAAKDNVFSLRDGIWRTGLAAWEEYPWFGVGKDNYGLITPERVRAWRVAAGKDYDASRYVQFPHAHSLYVNTLAERGAVGLATLAACLVAALAALLRFRPRPADADFAWLAWGGAASAWLVTAGVGLVNTTFHHEHGLLAALLLALWLSTLPARPASS